MDQVCLLGNYGQRREGKDVTDAVKAAIDGKQTSAIKMPPTPSAPRAEKTQQRQPSHWEFPQLEWNLRC